MISISGPSSSAGRPRLSSESMKRVTCSIPAAVHQPRNSVTLAPPARYPSRTSACPACRAQRRLPSSMIPTCWGRGSPARVAASRRSYTASIGRRRNSGSSFMNPHHRVVDPSPDLTRGLVTPLVSRGVAPAVAPAGDAGAAVPGAVPRRAGRGRWAAGSQAAGSSAGLVKNRSRSQGTSCSETARNSEGSLTQSPSSRWWTSGVTTPCPAGRPGFGAGDEQVRHRAVQFGVADLPGGLGPDEHLDGPHMPGPLRQPLALRRAGLDQEG